MGFGLPAAIGARFAQQREKVVVIAGDGSMTYAIGELSTLAKYGLDIIVIVLNNSCLGYTKIIETLDWHSNFESSNFPPTDFATISKGFGCTGLAVDNANDLSDVLDQAFQENGPVLIDVKVDETQVPELALRKRLSELKS
jgi:acetolactate synthase-1/2/3 large subunit